MSVLMQKGAVFGTQGHSCEQVCELLHPAQDLKL